MPVQKCLYYKITEYVVISNASYDASQRMMNRNKPKPSLKVYTQAAGAEMTDATLPDKPLSHVPSLYR